jgi:hypothetical protein
VGIDLKYQEEIVRSVITLFKGNGNSDDGNNNSGNNGDLIKTAQN